MILFSLHKEPSSGTGLGLSLSYGIIEKHKGEILVDNRKGGVSVFTVLLPAVRQGMA